MPASRSTTLCQIAVLPQGEEKRQFRRRLVNFSAWLDEAGVTSEAVQILDLSERGCRVLAKAQLPVGSAMVLKLPGVEALRATVAWCDGKEAGCTFEEELHEAIVESFLETPSKPQVRVPPGAGFGLREVSLAAPDPMPSPAPSVRTAQSPEAIPGHFVAGDEGSSDPVWIVPSFGRGEARLSTAVSAAYRNGLKRSTVELVNISPSGAKICAPEPLEAGSSFWIKLPLLEPLEMSVVWAKGLEAGCSFLQPLDQASFRVIAQAVRR
jgi:hypothetical protein